jgi:GT2 family glycosyltransferase/glycosyltransferase involved in cell wall biosynthesis
MASFHPFGARTLATRTMHWYLKLLIYPLLEALGPRVVVEVGVEVGAVTGPLLQWAQANGATVHAIDPDPTLNVDRLQAAYGEQLSFHRRKSLEVMGEIADVDLALIDGDHNWYTVIEELRALERRAREDGREPPVVLLHDVGWPYGRRDLYYDPQAIPEAHRQPHARGGVKPGRSELGPGLNDHLENAQLEGTPANGVLTAVEDHVAQSPIPWRTRSLPGLSGMAILASATALEASEPLRELLETLERPAFLRALCEAIEQARIDAELKRANIQRRLAETQLKQVMRSPDPRAQVALHRQVRELTERVAELEEDKEESAALEEQVRVLGGELRRLTDAGAACVGDERVAPPTEERNGTVPTLEEPDPAPEREAWRTLLDLYLPLLDGALPCADGRDPLSAPAPLDVRGVLCAEGEEQEPDAPSVDVVVCVHDALAHVRECLWSLLAKTERRLRLIVVDDGSAEPTARFVRAFADRHPAVTLIRRAEPPHGYTLAANLGLEASRSDYVVLLNSDTVLSPGWLERILACGERHPEVGILGPLSNAASHQSLPLVREGGAWATNPLPSALTVDAVGAVVASESLRAAHPGPQIRSRQARDPAGVLFPFINGFCYAIKRKVLERVGLLDGGRFAEGYCEENDYSLRARAAGFQLAVVDDAYVYHAKSASYGVEGRAELAQVHYERFLEKHGREEVQALVAAQEGDGALALLRAAVAEAVASPRAVAQLLGGSQSMPLSVVFLLPGLAHGGSGGSHSLYQEARALRGLGVPARVMLPRWDMARAAAVYEDAHEIFEAFADEQDLAERTRDAHVISATHHKSVALLAAIRERRSDFLAAYYVQDYEPFFTAPYIAQEAVASYTALPDMLLFAKSHWLCNVVAERHGLSVAKVEPSIDREVFTARATRSRADSPRSGESAVSEPRETFSGSGPLRVVAMVRPRTARRQPLATVAVLEELLARHPGEVQVSTFGCYADELAELLGGSARAIQERHLGLLSRATVADLLRETDVFLDMSVYQAFGRTALEAMACGATAVVPAVGGVWEFVEHRSNALAVDTLDSEAALAALGDLVGDRELLERLQAGALATATRYSATRAALSEYVLFERAYRARFGGPAADDVPAALLAHE